MELCMITLGTRPYIRIDVAANLVGTTAEAFQRLLLDTSQPNVCLVRTADGMFVEESSVAVIVRVNYSKETGDRWDAYMNRNGSRRRLTEKEKKIVAASQNYRCKECGCRLGATFECDHIEQHALRANNRRSNLQCLCPGCHRLKSLEQSVYGDPLFDTRTFDRVVGEPTTTQKNKTSYKEGGNVFSSYFFHSR